MNSYQNFDLSLYGYQVVAGAEQFCVRVAASPAGELPPDDAESVTLTPEIRQQLRQLEQPRLPGNVLAAIGQALAGLLLPPRVRELFSRSLAALSDKEGLRIRIDPDTYALANLPWEFTNIASDIPALGDGFLVLNQKISLVRREIQGQMPNVFDPIGNGPLEMAALLADLNCPPEYPPLQLDIELSKIEEIIQNRLPNIVNPHFYPDATIDTLEEALERQPHVFHFAGHSRFEGDLAQSYGKGSVKGGVVLMTNERKPRQLSAEKLASSLEGKVRLAVLGACESGRRGEINAWAGIVPALTRRGIPAVLSMQYTILPDYAIVFIRYLYRGLAADQPIDAAVTEGRRKIFQRCDDDERDWGVPVLYLRTDEARIFPRLAPVAVSVGPSQAAHADQQRRSMQTSFVDLPSGSADLRNTSALEINQTDLRKKMISMFEREELDVVCADVEQRLRARQVELVVSLDMAGGNGLESRVLNLIKYLERRGYLSVLLEVLRERRPGAF